MFRSGLDFKVNDLKIDENQGRIQDLGLGGRE
jgi:hypothetical protein